MRYSAEQVAAVIARHLPGRSVATLAYRGLWIRHVYKLTLDNGQQVVLKVRADDDTSDPTTKEAWAADLLLAHGLPAPRTLALDSSCELLDQPFILQEAVSGRTLRALIAEADEATASALYGALGRFYGQVHAIHHDRSGWVVGAGEVMPFSPNRFMHQKVIVEHGERAVEAGLIARSVYEEMVRVSAQNLPYLEDHTPSLVVGSALPWAIYLEHDGEWRVTKVMDLHDTLYWDPAFDLAMLKYPPFGSACPGAWAAFLSEYGPEPPQRRMLLYLLIQRIDAGLGNYMEPQAVASAEWVRRSFAEFPGLLEAIGRADG